MNYHLYDIPKHLKHYISDPKLSHIVKFSVDEWIDKGSYFLSVYPQGSEKWLQKRVDRITQSNMGKVVGDAPYFDGTPEQLARQLTGIEKEVFSEEAIKRMNMGTFLEPSVRKYLEKTLKTKINEVGLAVWKRDPRFGASLDGELENDTGLEIKCPAKMYQPLVDRMDFPFKYSDNSFMWKSHLYQVIGNAVITEKKRMIYCVYAHEEKREFRHCIKVEDEIDKWYEYLYPRACKFYDEFMIPLIKNRSN